MERSAHLVLPLPAVLPLAEWSALCTECRMWVRLADSLRAWYACRCDVWQAGIRE